MIRAPALYADFTVLYGLFTGRSYAPGTQKESADKENTMNTNARRFLLTLSALTAVGLSLAGHAFAQAEAPGAPSAPPIQAQVNPSARDTDAHDRAMFGSIQLHTSLPDFEVPAAQEQALYRSLARITPAQAEQAAQAAVLGPATSVTLGDQDGSLVYAVVIGQTEVTVDAGNGQILQQEIAGLEQGESGGS
ncbi:hypothetical protein GCM10025871_42590 [Deinococcus metallilatus]|nr:hypothetical protein GCM10025871_42590 [Deinococcus metallilatus]